MPNDLNIETKPDTQPLTTENRDTNSEHNNFAIWLENQPSERKEMYLNLAMAYGFRMHGTTGTGDQNE